MVLTFRGLTSDRKAATCTVGSLSSFDFVHENNEAATYVVYWDRKSTEPKSTQPAHSGHSMVHSNYNSLPPVSVKCYITHTSCNTEKAEHSRWEQNILKKF